DLQSHLDNQERDILIQALRETGFNRTVAAARLGISLRQMRYRIARLHIETPNSSESFDETS
ncbi:MAG: helix-turn-helix domain-containing protein, partial [Rhodoferax sp.]|nr:helix-turn-helix domain-containing protein [Rhodoferax sp.]